MGNDMKFTEKNVEEKENWDAADLADSLGPFGSLENLKSVLEDWPAPEVPEYHYFFWLAKGLDPAYFPPKAMTVSQHVEVLHQLTQFCDDPFLAEEAAGYRDGIVIQYEALGIDVLPQDS